MKCFVDGYNLLFSQDELRRILDTEGLDSARKRLLSGVAAYATLRSLSVVVVFDGSPEVVGVAREETVQGVRCIYSVGQGKADRRILLLLDAEPQPGDCVVVTSDREVRVGARHRGAKVQAADLFWRDAMHRPATDKPGSRDSRLSKNEVDDWLRYFGFDSDGDT